MPRFRSLLLVIIFSAMVLVLAIPISVAVASPLVLYEISGIVTEPHVEYEPIVSVGDPVDLTLLVDAGVPDSNVRRDDIGFYSGSVLSAELSIGHWGVASSNLGNLTVRDGSAANPTDLVSLVVGVAGEPLQSNPYNLFLDFMDASGDAIDDDAFPDLERFIGAMASGRITFFPRAPRISFEVTAFRMIPEPATGCLLGLGLIALGIRRRA